MWRQLLGGSQQWLAKVAGLNGMAVTPFVCTSFQEGAHWSPVDVLAHLDHDSMLEALDTLSDEGNAEVRQAQDSLASRLYGSKNTRPMPKVKARHEDSIIRLAGSLNLLNTVAKDIGEGRSTKLRSKGNMLKIVALTRQADHLELRQKLMLQGIPWREGQHLASMLLSFQGLLGRGSTLSNKLQATEGKDVVMQDRGTHQAGRSP